VLLLVLLPVLLPVREQFGKDPPRQLVHIQKRVMKYLNHMQSDANIRKVDITPFSRPNR